MKSLTALPDDDKTTSPVYTWGDKTPIYRGKPLTVDLFAALKAVADGKWITRLGWNDPTAGCGLESGILKIYKTDSELTPEIDDGSYKYHNWIISSADLTATDWVIIP